MRKVLDGVFQAVSVSLVPHGSGGGASVRWCGELYEDGDMVRSGGWEGGGIPGLESWANEGIGEGQVDSTGPEGAREGEPGVDARSVEEGVGQVGGPIEIGCRGLLLRAGGYSQRFGSGVLYVEVPGNQAGEVNVREGVGRAHRLGGPGEGTGVDVCESKLSGSGVKTTCWGINIEVKDLCRTRRNYLEDGVKRQKTQGNIKGNRGFGGRRTEGLEACKARQEAFP